MAKLNVEHWSRIYHAVKAQRDRHDKNARDIKWAGNIALGKFIQQEQEFAAQFDEILTLIDEMLAPTLDANTPEHSDPVPNVAPRKVKRRAQREAASLPA